MHALETACAGIRILAGSPTQLIPVARRAQAWLNQLGLAANTVIDLPVGHNLVQLRARSLPEGQDLYDTTGLSRSLGQDASTHGDDLTLTREIVAAMLMGPQPFDVPSLDELQSHVRIRQNIVQAARRTVLAFHTSEAERPAAYWSCDDERGFHIRPGMPLIDALRAATQPAPDEPLYAFSCYRATEYVILLAIAQELAQINPSLLAALQRQCEHSFIRSGTFHDVFLREHGTAEQPLPPLYYVPGDRVWFRNPDEASADAAGFEGSWVFYLGGGLFSNFWERDDPYTLPDKCLEVYHWRHGTWRDDTGELHMDEQRVADHVRGSLANGEATHLVSHMMRYRDPRGVYAHGGCIDSTREYPRWVCPGSVDLLLPPLSA